MSGQDLAASVRARLLNIAKAEGSDFNQVLVRFALERLLYRVGASPHADRFLLKGALLFTLWYDMPHRPTRDADLLGFGPSSLEAMRGAFREIAAVHVADGIVFEPDSVQVQEIRKEAGYGGVRVLLTGDLARARCRTQVDIGFGDAVTPTPMPAVYPVLIDGLPAPRLRVYPAYTVVAEKLHAIVLLGMANSRVKDYFDLAVLLQREELDAYTLGHAVAATFARRKTALPTAVPIGLSDEFAIDASRQTLWRAFLRKNDLEATPLADTVTMLRERLWPVLQRARTAQG
ncbi:nucleotidyl transferase AbiEii/AbiGii toxin family protein [Azohydromonas lata]|uniref:Nucleotidyl transferase AbiEii/AbiGii toxin family protein n=1 Tax=Azohydromonas lata TaxID=45677 RepID=A0ABU5IHC5_9BURK|nr:nucleotidyl transferase AbiEii/AbiGii toxin family protein [Azohydromonas lata]MDZ5458010.1 nucleotidyl transferase AbiEii/AbiGii toxin family protein [Azohydromonas lata]